MKRMTAILSVATAMVLLCGLSASADDVRVNYSELPAKAKSFVAKYFGETPSVREVELDGGEYTVELRNGYEVKFNSAGDPIEIDAQGKKKLDVDMVKALLPSRAVDYLSKKKLLNDVDEIKFVRGGGYVVEIDKMMKERKLRFDSEGHLVKMNNK